MTPDVDRLKNALATEKALAGNHTGYGFRNVAQRWAKPGAVHSTVGSRLTGALYNHIGTFGALYVSLTWTTSFLEALQEAEDEEEIANMLPRTLIGIRIACDHILDLRSTVVRQRLGVSRPELVGREWKDLQPKGIESTTQTIGHFAFEAGFRGILAPSAVELYGGNLVLFPDNFSPSDRCEVINELHLTPAAAPPIGTATP